MAEQRDGGIAGNDRMAESRNGGTAEWKNGGMAAYLLHLWYMPTTLTPFNLLWYRKDGLGRTEYLIDTWATN